MKFNLRRFQSYHYHRECYQRVKSLESEQQNTTTIALVRRSAKGDTVAFRSLMESQEDYAFVLAFRLLHDEEDAKDVVQEAFIRVWNNCAGYRPEIKFTTWLYKIVVNLCYDTIKRRSRRNTVFGYVLGRANETDIVDRRDLQTDIENVDLRNIILSVSKELSPMENLVFHLRDVQDFSIREVAEITGISMSSVKTNLCYARKRIRFAINKIH